MKDKDKTKEQFINELVELRQQNKELKSSENKFTWLEESLREKTQLNQILLDSIPCIALLMRPHTREIIASNEYAAKVKAVPGTKCFSTWGQREDP